MEEPIFFIITMTEVTDVKRIACIMIPQRIVSLWSFFFFFSLCQLVDFWFHNWAKHIEKTVVQCLWRHWGDVHWQQEWQFVQGHFTSFQLQLQTSKGKHLVSENWSFYDIFTPCRSRKAIDRPMTNKWFWIKLTDGSPGRVCAPRFRLP